MTPAGKWLTLGLTVTVLLGGSGGGAYYYHKRELRRAVETQEAALKTLRDIENVVVRDPVVAELILPRFLAPGDEAQATLNIDNYAADQRVEAGSRGVGPSRMARR